MIDDSLKRARQSYFLILAIASITTLFSFSIRKPDKLVYKKEIVEKLLKLDISAYDQFINKKIIEIPNNNIDNFLNKIDTLNIEISGIDKIISELEKLDYSGRLYLKRSEFNNISECNFQSLSNINLLETKKNLQWFIPELESLERDIISFFVNSNLKEIQVDDVNVGGIRNSFDSSTYYALENIDLSLNFKITSTNVAFKSVVRGTIEDIPNTSFEYWLKTKKNDNTLLKKDSDKLVWFNGDDIFDVSERQTSFKDLLPIINEGLNNYSAEKQSIHFLGIKIPGSFFIIASPILIILLVYFLYSNLLHLKEIINIEDQDHIKKFSWTALNGSDKFKSVERVFVVLIAPLFSLLTLMYNLRAEIFSNGIYISTIFFIIMCMIICCVLARKAILQFKDL